MYKNCARPLNVIQIRCHYGTSTFHFFRVFWDTLLSICPSVLVPLPLYVSLTSQTPVYLKARLLKTFRSLSLSLPLYPCLFAPLLTLSLCFSLVLFPLICLRRPSTCCSSMNMVFLYNRHKACIVAALAGYIIQWIHYDDKMYLYVQ